MNLVDYFRSLFSCFSTTTTASSCSTKAVTKFPNATTTTNATSTVVKTRRSSSLADHLPLIRGHHHESQESDDDDHEAGSLISFGSRFLPSPSRSRVVGTIYGHRRGRVSFCVQKDPANPPPFLLELSIPTYFLAKEMQAGLLRIALECDRRDPSNATSGVQVWKAYCNGRKVGYAVRRRPTHKDRLILRTVQSTSAGAGVLSPGHLTSNREGELMFMRATYERVVGSRDSESYHLINPGGTPDQELSVFLLRTG